MAPTLEPDRRLSKFAFKTNALPFGLLVLLHQFPQLFLLQTGAFPLGFETLPQVSDLFGESVVFLCGGVDLFLCGVDL